MEIIFKDNRQYELLYRYSKYFIRFEAGEMMPIPCDLEITEDEKDGVLKGAISMSELLSKYMKTIPWTEKEFMRRGFTNFFREQYHCTDEEIERNLDKLSSNSALRIEMYIAIMNEKLPVNCWVKVNEKKASDYVNELGVDYAGAYMYMLENC
ncbi:hypothetical protein [Butyrivibrio sp. VCB2001]|uniref:hypothetical protein n=1 Tax=Butyrivibrio sp. VCB2001 TaxID=1280667 RepID=UPI0012DCDF05|nr:hypothetical protein [Butyrivibrio sp. VCB2001]